MKFKIVTDGKAYLIFERFLWWWCRADLPIYNSVRECEDAIFRVYAECSKNIAVEYRGNK